MAVTGFCVKCRAKRDVKDPTETTLKNNRKAYVGTCSVCGAKMVVFMKGK